MLKDAVSGLLAVCGAAAIFHSGNTLATATLAFLLAALLSCWRPQQNLYWALFAGGTFAASEGWKYAVAPQADEATLISVMVAAVLALAIGAAGAGAGKSLSVFDHP